MPENNYLAILYTDFNLSVFYREVWFCSYTIYIREDAGLVVIMTSCQCQFIFAFLINTTGENSTYSLNLAILVTYLNVTR